MAKQRTSIRKRRLEEKLGLTQDDVIKLGFDQEIKNIVWDIANKKYESMLDHPMIIQDEPAWPDWVFFLVVHNVHAAIWAIEEKHLSTIEMVSQDFLTDYEVSECITSKSIVHRFHVVVRSDGRYYAQADVLDFLGKEPVYDVCLYVGTVTLSLRGIQVMMAMIAQQNYLLLHSDCLDFCKDFVMVYFEMIEEELSPDQVKVLDSLTVTTNALLAASERSGRQNKTSGWSLRSILTSTVVQVYVGSLLGGVTLYFLYRIFSL